MPERKQRVLIVDPDSKAQMKIANSLIMVSNEDYDIQTCSGLYDAVDLLKKRDFDCIIMDVNLPEMEGYKAVPILRALFPEVKIIMTSSSNSRQIESRIREQGIFYYYIKSFDIDELVQTVKILFKRDGRNHGLLYRHT